MRIMAYVSISVSAKQRRGKAAAMARWHQWQRSYALGINARRA